MTQFIQSAAGAQRSPDHSAAAVDPAVLRRDIDARLAEIGGQLAGLSPGLDGAMAEAILGRGKRFRGVLMLLLAHQTGAAGEAALDAACAVEIVHAATLIIDDLPSMDAATLRRGAPTTHVAHGESRAILAGIALLAEAFRLVARARGADGPARAAMAALLADCIGSDGLCAGQDLDLHADKTPQGIAREQDLKTGVLFVAGFRMIAVLNGCSAAQSDAIADVAALLGRVFQAHDDILDSSGSAAQLGKQPGMDVLPGGRAKGLLAVASPAETAAQYRALRQRLDAALAALWFGAEPLRAYVGSILPDLPDDFGAYAGVADAGAGAGAVVP